MQVVAGIVLIALGIFAGLTAWLAAGMLSREPTWWELLWTPVLLFAVPASIGIWLLV